MRKTHYMDPKKQSYKNSGELFEEVISELYGAPVTPKEDEDAQEDEDQE